jgi:hypothetical protein
LHLIGFAPLRGEFVLAGFAFVQPLLQISRANRHTWGAAIDSRTQGWPVAFAPCCDAEKMSKGVNAHVLISFGLCL